VTKALVAPYRIIWIAVAVAIISPLASMGIVLKILNDSKEPSRVIVVDAADNFIVGPLQNIDQSPIFERSGKLATLAALSRTAAGFDYPEMAKGIFYGDALKRLETDLQKQLPNLRAQNLHQKVEISTIQTVETVGAGRKLYIFGSIGRFGTDVSGYAVTHAESYRLILVLVPNPRLGERGAYPYVVNDYRLQVGPNAPKPKP
jgi:hypothetical protein